MVVVRKHAFEVGHTAVAQFDRIFVANFVELAMRWKNFLKA